MKSCRCRAGCILMRLAELEGSQADLLVACVRGSPPPAPTERGLVAAALPRPRGRGAREREERKGQSQSRPSPVEIECAK